MRVEKHNATLLEAMRSGESDVGARFQVRPRVGRNDGRLIGTPVRS
jgi:hypothetical protein